MMRKTVKARNEELAKDQKKLRHYGMKLMAIPTPKQEELIRQSVGTARFTFNFYLREKQEVYRETGETLTYSEFHKAFFALKTHPLFSFLKTPDKFALECAMDAVDDAYDRFFNGQNQFPKFKSKHAAKQSYSTKFTNHNIQLDTEKQCVKLPKLGWVNVRFSKKQQHLFKVNGFGAAIKGATVTVHNGGKTFISLKLEEVVDLPEPTDWAAVSPDTVIGCDLGLTHFLIDSNGNKIDNPKPLQNHLNKLAQLQRQLKKKQKGSANYRKQQQKIARLHLRIANTRADFLHQQSRKLVNENQVIVLEDLNVKGMIKNRKLARNLADVGWSKFITFVLYKADWANKKVVLIDRFFASTKQCGGCKEKNTLLSLSNRVWVCPSCGSAHDRDINAANNIKEEGLRLLKSPQPV